MLMKYRKNKRKWKRERAHVKTDRLRKNKFEPNKVNGNIIKNHEDTVMAIR